MAEAAERLGVSVARIHQRIADGSLDAHRLGSQWAVEELSLLRVAERHQPGRSLSPRSAWAIIATAEQDHTALAALAPIERARAAERLHRLLASATEPIDTEGHVQTTSATLRRLFRHRAARHTLTAAATDLGPLRRDGRWQALVDAADTGIAASDIDGYITADDVESVIRDYLLTPADADTNVVVHVLPHGQRAYPSSRLRLAADLAEHRGPREELRALALLREHARRIDRRG